MAAKRRMLVVDDSQIDREILKGLFHEEFDVLEASNGKQALEILKRRRNIAVVLLDLIMPLCDGYGVLKTMQEDKKLSEIPVIVVTEMSEPTVEVRVLEMGASDIIQKPYIPKVILRRVRNVISAYDARRSDLSNAIGELKYLAVKDKLTDLPNSAAFFKATRAMLKKNPDIQYAIARINIERFKTINEIYGLKVGDRLLRFIAASLKDYAAKNGATCCRLEADNFMICYKNFVLEADPVMEGFIRKVNDFLPGYKVIIHFGIYVIDDIDLPIDVMCDRTSIALRTIKGSFIRNWAYYDEELKGSLRRKQEIINEMDTALEKGQFDIYLQPIYSISTNSPIAAEALIRWFHPTRGVISPGEFIPVFEENGFIVNIDFFVWERVCQMLSCHLDEGIPILPVSVNISRINLYNPHLVEHITNLVRRYNLDPSLLRLEITESAYTDTPLQMTEIINDFKSEGFTVMMDDFGSGYSSLNMLKDTDFDILKIDMAFLKDVETNARASSILTSVVRMAKWIGMPVVAEGVETQRQMEFLRSIGCNRVQGYFYSKPLPVAEYEKLISQGVKYTETIVTAVNRSYDLSKFDELWNTNAKLNSVFGGVVGGIGIFELANDAIEAIRVNDAYYDIIGYTPQSFYAIAPNILKILDAGNAKILLEAFERAAVSDRVEFATYRRPSSTGRDIWIDAKIRYWGGDESRSVYYVSITDVTEEKAREKEMQYNMYTSAFSVAFDDIMEIDLKNATYKLLYTSTNEIAAKGKEFGAFADLKQFLSNFCLAPSDRKGFADWFSEERIQTITTRESTMFKNAQGRDVDINIIPILSDDTERYLICAKEVK